MASQFLINGMPLIECHLIMPKVGPWLANDVLVNSEASIKVGDKVTMNILDQTFNGTVLDATVDGNVYLGFQRITIQGGSGKMNSLLQPIPYNSTTVGQIVRDIARNTLHTVSISSNQLLLNTTVIGWNILKMKASLALEKVIEPLKAIWRILPDGTLFVGPEVYVPLDPLSVQQIEQFPAQSRWDVYNEDTLIQPGSSLLGNEIKQVEYFIQGVDLQISLYFTDTSSDSLIELTSQDDDILYNSQYRCQVVVQHADGSVDVLPNPSIDVIKNGFVNVPIVYPFPGMKINVLPGAICFVTFANGDPQYPRVTGWEDSGNATLVEVIHTGAQPAARKGDGCGYLLFNPGMSGATLTYSATIPIGPGTPVGPIQIQEGSTVVKIGT